MCPLLQASSPRSPPAHLPCMPVQGAGLPLSMSTTAGYIARVCEKAGSTIPFGFCLLRLLPYHLSWLSFPETESEIGELAVGCLLGRDFRRHIYREVGGRAGQREALASNMIETEASAHSLGALGKEWPSELSQMDSKVKCLDPPIRRSLAYKPALAGSTRWVRWLSGTGGSCNKGRSSEPIFSATGWVLCRDLNFRLGE